jgi:proteasome assembly chaperone (PAC2) family protein
VSELYVLHERPELESPVLVVALDGWVDAGLAAATVVQTLAAELNPVTIATFSSDLLIDYRARRPTMQLRDGVNSAIVWPGITLQSAADAEGNHLLLLVGHEPDTLWQRFAREVVDLALDLGVRMMCGLGAYPATVPHTRPSLLSVSATSDVLAAQSGWQRNTIDVPAGVTSVLERACGDRGLPAFGLWAQVPHYVAAMPYPAAALALIEGLVQIAGLKVRAEGLEQAAQVQRDRIDQLVAANPEHVAMVRGLEAAYDAQAPQGFAPTDLPSGDELAAELERFLRDQRPD